VERKGRSQFPAADGRLATVAVSGPSPPRSRPTLGMRSLKKAGMAEVTSHHGPRRLKPAASTVVDVGDKPHILQS
jgi:hypothetical protein